MHRLLQLVTAAAHPGSTITGAPRLAGCPMVQADAFSRHHHRCGLKSCTNWGESTAAVSEVSIDPPSPPPSPTLSLHCIPPGQHHRGVQHATRAELDARAPPRDRSSRAAPAAIRPARRRPDLPPGQSLARHRRRSSAAKINCQSPCGLKSDELEASRSPSGDSREAEWPDRNRCVAGRPNASITIVVSADGSGTMPQ